MKISTPYAIIELTSKGAKVVSFHRYGEVIEWPEEVLSLKAMAQPGDTGLGDIAERIIGEVNGDKYMAWYRATFGKPCRGTWDKNELNKRFPLGGNAS